jgi:hypothetical protein
MPTKSLMSSTLGVVLGEANWLRRCIFASAKARKKTLEAFGIRGETVDRLTN